MPGSCGGKMQSQRALGFWASWPADPAGLTFCTSEGTLVRKSSTSLLSMLYGFRSFLVNLLMPKTEIHTNISLTVSLLWLHSLVSTQTNTCRGGSRCPRNITSRVLRVRVAFLLYFHFTGGF